VKRLLCLIFILCLSLGITACKSGRKDGSNTSSSSSEQTSGCKHVYDAATCTTPKTCIKCGETVGEPLGHKWEPANCQTPKKCFVCDITEGGIEHNYQNGTCAVCKAKNADYGKQLNYNWRLIKGDRLIEFDFTNKLFYEYVIENISAMPEDKRNEVLNNDLYTERIIDLNGQQWFIDSGSSLFFTAEGRGDDVVVTISDKATESEVGNNIILKSIDKSKMKVTENTLAGSEWVTAVDDVFVAINGK
jgi:hypothetical protein